MLKTTVKLEPGITRPLSHIPLGTNWASGQDAVPKAHTGYPLVNVCATLSLFTNLTESAIAIELPCDPPKFFVLILVTGPTCSPCSVTFMR